MTTMDYMDYYHVPPSEQMKLFYANATWKKRFCFIPRRCAITNKLIWLTIGVKGVATFLGPGGGLSPISVTFWHDTNEHLIWLLATL